MGDILALRLHKLFSDNLYFAPASSNFIKNKENKGGEAVASTRNERKRHTGEWLPREPNPAVTY